MGRQLKEHEDVVQALSLLEQVTAILDASGLNEIAVHTDYAKQLLDQNILITPLFEPMQGSRLRTMPKTLDAKDV